MDAVAEREVSHVGPIEVEPVRIGVLVGIAVRRCQVDDDLRTRRDRHATDVDLLERIAEGRVRHRCVVAEDLLDHVRDPRRIRPQTRPRARVAEERDDAVADQAGRGVVPRDDQLEDGREQLFLVEPFLAVTRRDQGAHQRVVGMPLLLLDHGPEHPHDRVRSLLGERVLLVGRRRGEQDAERTTELRSLTRREPEQLTDHGERQRERERGTRSTTPSGPPAARPSSSSSTIACTRGRSPSIRRTENAAATSRRSRV